MPQTILLINDADGDRATYERFLHRDDRQSYQIIEFDNGKEALIWCQNNVADIILLDSQLADMDGLEFLRQLRQQQPHEILPVIMLTDVVNTAVAVESLKLGAQEYLDKQQISQVNLPQLMRIVFQQVQLKRKLSCQQEQQQILIEMALWMRQSLDPQSVLDGTTQEVRRFLQADRALVYQFAPNWSGSIVSEATVEEYPVVLGQQIQDTCFQQKGADLVAWTGRPWAIADIDQADLTDCHRESLKRFAIKANLVVPILQYVPPQPDATPTPSLWGLLIVHHCAAPHNWQVEELNFLKQVAIHLSGAIQQASLYQQAQAELAERKRAELALQESEARLRLAQSASKSSVWDWDLQANTFIWSPEYYGLYKLDRSIEPSYETWLACIHPDDRDQVTQKMTHAIENGNSEIKIDYRLVSTDAVQWVAEIGQIFRDAAGKAIRLIGITIDITQQKQAEIALQASNEQLQAINQDLDRANQAKDAFLRMMSHELRTPLNPILGIADALQEEIFGTLNPRQTKAVSKIINNGWHLLTLINSILELVDLEASKIKLNRHRVLVKDLCKASLFAIQPDAEAKSIQLQSYIASEISFIHVDSDRMKQVLTLLLKNAIKFTSKGGTVTLSVQLRKLDIPSHLSAALFVQFSVQDTGIGIASENLQHLFQFFTQLDNRLSRNYEGIGIGLAIAGRLVELHGGHITVESQEGYGSCFNINIPV
jgi:PAS domain S-box-containing protein